MVRAAAAAGKVILSEKSLTTTYADATSLVAAVQDAGVFFVEGLMYLSHPLYAQFATLLRDPRLGEIRSINGVYAADIKDVVNAAGGGTLYNLGCYPASLLHFVVQQACGEESLRDYQIAAVGSLNSDGNICDTAAAFKFGNGVQATLQSTDSYGMHHSFEVMGTKGSLRFVTNPWLPSAGENIIEIAPYKGAVESVVVESGFDAFHHQIAMVEDCVARGVKEATRPSPRWSDSLAIMRFLTDWEAAVRG
jgi:predicted dehydrogenase